MCNRRTLPAERAMCGCHTRRSVAAVITTVAVVVGAWLVPSLELVAFAAAAVAAAVIAPLAWSRGAGVTVLHRYTPEQPPEPAPRGEWWERGRVYRP